MWYYLGLWLLVGRSFFHSFSRIFCASTCTRSCTLYCARWSSSSKRKKRRQRENACQAKNEGERKRMMCRGHSRARMYYKKKHLLLYSFVFLSHVCFFFLALFFRLSLVLLSSSSSSTSSSFSLFVDIRTAMFFVCSMPFTLLVRVSDGRREQDDEGATQWCEMLMSMCVRARADRLYFLSIYDDDEDDAENACAPVLPIYFEPTRRCVLVPSFSDSCLMLRFFRSAS